MAIPQRDFGQTGLRVSRLGLGLAALGRPGYINLGHSADLNGDYTPEAMRSGLHTVLDAAWAAGIRYVDAARSYGRAEEFLGDWLRSRQPDQIVVASKWGYIYTAGWQVNAEVHEVKDHSLPVLQRQWGETQSYLGDWLRIYQIHSATLDSGALTDQSVLNALAKLKAQGVLVGLSVSGHRQPQTIEHAASILVDGVRLFDCVQATWNLLETSAAAALAAAHELGLSVIVKEALANGRLTSRNREPSFAARRQRLTQEAERLNTTPECLALAAAIAQPWADVVLSGAATPDQIQSNAAAFDVAWDELAAEQLSSLAEDPRLYWETRSRLAWN